MGFCIMAATNTKKSHLARVPLTRSNRCPCIRMDGGYKMDICRTVVTKCKFVLVRLQVYSRRHITRSPMILQSNFGRFNKRENKTSPDRNAILITAYRVFYSSVRNESFGQTDEKPMPWRCNATASLYNFSLCFRDLS